MKHGNITFSCRVLHQTSFICSHKGMVQTALELTFIFTVLSNMHYRIVTKSRWSIWNNGTPTTVLRERLSAASLGAIHLSDFIITRRRVWIHRAKWNSWETNGTWQLLAWDSMLIFVLCEKKAFSLITVCVVEWGRVGGWNCGGRLGGMLKGKINHNRTTHFVTFKPVICNG